MWGQEEVGWGWGGVGGAKTESRRAESKSVSHSLGTGGALQPEEPEMGTRTRLSSLSGTDRCGQNYGLCGKGGLN